MRTVKVSHILVSKIMVVVKCIETGEYDKALTLLLSFTGDDKCTEETIDDD